MATADPSRRTKSKDAHRTLPPVIDLDETVAGVAHGPAPEPEAGRNMDQHRALQDD